MRVQVIPPSEAAERLAGLAELDPRGLCTEADILPMCRAGECLELEADTGCAVVVVDHRNGVAWINAAAGVGSDMTEAIDAALIARGARVLAFQTRRPGLVRRAKRLGYQVTGYILTKQCAS